MTYRERWGKDRQRVVKGHPLREARRARAAERLAAHVFGAGCGKNCPKRPKA